ncbi:MAG: T9SS type A sorting domain-containing protein [Bacteroidetes bacterium]|nr:T9SS type A sorting domain-containing protein [Bacteroidota bacterium]
MLSSSMILYPNPIKNSFTIEGMTGQNTIEIFSELGQLLNVVKSESSAKTINTENLTSGIYFVKVKGNEVEKVFRVNK